MANRCLLVRAFRGMKDIINYKDKRYIVKKEIKIYNEKNVDYFKSKIQHDLVLKRLGKYYFLDEITEVNILKKTKNGSE